MHVLQVLAQLKRLERLLTERDSKIPFCQHEKPSMNKKAAKKAKREQQLAMKGTASATANIKTKKKVKKGKGAKGKLPLGAVTKPKVKKNKDKYNKKKLAKVAK